MTTDQAIALMEQGKTILDDNGSAYTMQGQSIVYHNPNDESGGGMTIRLFHIQLAGKKLRVK